MTVEAARIVVDRRLPEILRKRSRAERRGDDLFKVALDKALVTTTAE